MKHLLFASAFAFASIAGATASVAADSPNLLVMIEDSDKDTVPRDSRVQRNILQGINDRMNSRGFRVFDEQAVGIDGYKETSASDRVRRTDQELIKVANSVARPPVDIVIAYEVFASTDKTDFANFARMRITGRALDPQSGRYMGSFEVLSPKTYKLPIDCTRECLLENLSEEGRDMGIELADVLADKLDQFYSAGGQAVSNSTGDGAVALSSNDAVASAGFERTYTLKFQECSAQVRSEFEPYLIIFDGYIDHRPNRCSATSCEMSYTSTINPGKLHRNLEKMLWHSENNGRVGVYGRDYSVTCIAQRQQTPGKLDPSNW